MPTEGLLCYALSDEASNDYRMGPGGQAVMTKRMRISTSRQARLGAVRLSVWVHKNPWAIVRDSARYSSMSQSAGLLHSKSFSCIVIPIISCCEVGKKIKARWCGVNDCTELTKLNSSTTFIYTKRNHKWRRFVLRGDQKTLLTFLIAWFSCLKHPIYMIISTYWEPGHCRVYISW